MAKIDKMQGLITLHEQFYFDEGSSINDVTVPREESVTTEEGGGKNYVTSFMVDPKNTFRWRKSFNYTL